MMNSTRRSMLAGGAGLAALGITGCGLSGSESTDQDAAEAVEGEVTGEITFQTWSLKNERFTPYFEDLVTAFQEANPGTTVKWIDQPGEGYADKLLSQANSESLPDVVNIPPDLAFPLARTGFLLDLGEADPELEDVYVTGGVSAYQYDALDVPGSYGYPWYLGTDMNFWNVEELTAFGYDEDNLPTSIEEVFEAARKVSEEGGASPVISSMPEIDKPAPDGKFAFNTPENIELVQKYADLFQAGGMPAEVLTSGYAGNATLFVQGKALWTTGTSSFADQLSTEAPTILQGTVATPRFGTPPLFTQGISVASKSANLPTALAFAKFATNTENQIAFVKIAQGFLPGTKDAAADTEAYAAESDIDLQDDAVEIAAESMKTAEVVTSVLWTEDMNVNLAQQLSQAMQGDITPQEALDQAVTYANDNVSTE